VSVAGAALHCDLCPPEAWRPEQLHVVVDGRLFCGAHWRAAGRPFPRTEATVEELHQAELATRERMQARGGADRHMVRSGKS